MRFSERASSRAGPTSARGYYRFGWMLGRSQRGIGSHDAMPGHRRGGRYLARRVPSLLASPTMPADRSRPLEIARAPEAQPAPVIPRVLPPGPGPTTQTEPVTDSMAEGA